MSRTSSMTPEELRAIIAEVYGNRQQRKVAADIDRSEVTVSRWLSGDMPIGGVEAMLMRLLLVVSRRGYNWRKWLEDYKAKPAGIEVAGSGNIEDFL